MFNADSQCNIFLPLQINELLEAQKAATKEVRVFCVLEWFSTGETTT